MMFLAKLKLVVGAVVMVTALGAVGLAYRATAQEPRRALNEGAPPSTRRAADDLESLRLEIEALRKELRATRERVKTLEGEVRTLKKPGGMPPGGTSARLGGPAASTPNWTKTPKPDTSPYAPLDNNATPRPTSGPERPDPLTEAMRRVERDPDDKEAVQALVRELKRLKEREQPRRPGPTYYPEK